MMIFSQIQRFFYKYNNLSNLTSNEYYSLGVLIFLLKLLMVVLISFLDWKEGLSFYTNAGDDGQYIGYSENLFQEGEYYYDSGNSGNKNYFFRMPGITFLYLPLRFLFNQNITLNLFVILQVLLSTFALIKFLKLVNQYLKVNNLIFLFFSTFYLYSSYFESSLMTESLALSSLLLCLYYIDRAFHLETKKYMITSFLLAGFFLMWLIFLRPYMVPFLLLFAGYIIIKKSKVLYLIIFLLPFFIIDGVWTFRNYYNYNEIMPLQSSADWFNSSKSGASKTKFIQAFGFKWVNFEENSHSAWFNNFYEAPSINIPSDDIFPKRTFVGDLTIDSLIKARIKLHEVDDIKLDHDLRLKSDKEAARILDKFVLSLKTDRPFDYYVLNRVRLLFRFLKPNTPKLFKHGPYPFNIIVTKVDVLFSVLLKYVGLIGLLILLVRNFKKLDILILFLSVPIFLFLFFPIVLRIDETRFFYLSIPFLIVGLVYLFSIFQKPIFKIKETNPKSN